MAVTSWNQFNNPHNQKMAQLFSSSVGSSAIGGFMNRMQFNAPIYPIYTGGSVFGSYGCYSGGWNGGLYTFSDVVKDRNKVSFWDSFSAGFKEQLYVNPLGSLTQGVGIVAAGAGLLGNLANCLAGGGRNSNVC